MTPHLHGVVLDAEAFSDVGRADRITGHGSIMNCNGRVDKCNLRRYSRDMRERPKIAVRKTIVERTEDGFLAMDEDGNVWLRTDARGIVQALKSRDKRRSVLYGDSTATLIEWLNMPEGWEPPDVDV